MPSPSSALSTLRPDLASSMLEFDLAMAAQNYIGSKVLPIVPVAKKIGQYGVIPIEELLKDRNTERAPGSGYNRSQFTFLPQTFRCQEHGTEEPIDDDEAEMYAEYFDVEQVTALRAQAAILRNAEKRIAAAVFNATTWTSYTTSITNEWDDLANATPVTDVNTAKAAVFTQCGMWPNALIINRTVYNNLRNVTTSNQIFDRIKYSGVHNPTQAGINTAVLAEVFDLKHIIVAGGAYDSALEGQTSVPAEIWSNEYAMVCKIAETNDPKEPCIGRTFHWPGGGSTPQGTVETYRDETVRSDIVRVRHDVDEVIMYVEAGHLLDNVTT